MMSAPPPSTPTSTCGTTRRLSLLKKFGNCLMKSTATTSSSSDSLSRMPFSSSPVIERRRDSVQNGVAVGESNGDPLASTAGVAQTSSMRLPPPPPLPPTTVGTGNETGGVTSSHGQNMRRLLEDLHRSRVCFEQDQEALRQTGRDIKAIDTKLTKLTAEATKEKEKFRKLAGTAAFTRTELNSVEIKNKVVTGTLKKVEDELNQVLDELHKLRIQASEFCSVYLADSVQFGLQWNGTELGRENRIKFDEQEGEKLERQKRQLEFELADFLVLQKGVEESENEVQELSQQFNEKDAVIGKREKELQTRIDELDGTLAELEREEEEFQRSSFEEMEQLQKQIDEIQLSITSLQNQSAEAKATVKTQKNCNKRTQNHAQNLELQGQQQEKATNPNIPSCMASARETYAMSSFNQKPCESKAQARISGFQIPVKPQLQNQSKVGVVKGYTDTSHDNNMNSTYFSNNGNSNSSEGFTDTDSNSNSNDEEMLVAMAAEASQNLRAYEPMAPAPRYTQQNGQPPAKVRAMERQAPITAFMKQLSSTKVIKRPTKNSQSQGKSKNSHAANKAFVQPVAPVRTSAPVPTKTFQFKKKLSTGSIQSDSDKENSSVNSDPSFDDSGVDRTFRNESFEYSNNAPCKDNGVPELFDDMPFSRFGSSRAMLTESQEQRLDYG